MKFVILGGGTAGWLSALYIKKISPQSSVLVVESSKIGTIGVGEGTVPDFVYFLKIIDIPPYDIIKNCGATIKLGISFENWNGDNNRYFHSFDEFISDFSVPAVFNTDSFDYYLKLLVSKNNNIDDYLYSSILAYQNKIDNDRLLYALHFDVQKLSIYLKSVAKKRGIVHIDSTMQNVDLDDSGFVTALNLECGKKVESDFVIDASGQGRAIIGKIYNKKWISRRDELPVNSAIPFWLEPEAETRPYTRSIAMSSGWMWQIPVDGRVGAGYVFDDRYISAEEAAAEASAYLGKEVEVRKNISFEAGESEVFWHKNVMAVGLSSAFVEPLEATSIWTTTNQLIYFSHFLPGCDRAKESSVKIFNETMKETLDVIRSFVYFHYITKRKDSDFWKDFRHITTIPNHLKKILEDYKVNDLNWVQFESGLCNFKQSSYLKVGSGLGLLRDVPAFRRVFPTPFEYRAECIALSLQAQHHDNFLKNVNIDTA